MFDTVLTNADAVLTRFRLHSAQEEILWFCEAAHVPVIWATQARLLISTTYCYQPATNGRREQYANSEHANSLGHNVNWIDASACIIPFVRGGRTAPARPALSRSIVPRRRPHRCATQVLETLAQKGIPTRAEVRRRRPRARRDDDSNAT